MAVNNTETPPNPSPTSQRWPGWPGDNVFRMIVPVVKVGSIIGKRGELIKKLCDETGARVRILDGPLGTSDRVVLISGKEEPEAQVSPAMEAVLRVFKRINGISIDGKTTSDSGVGSVRLLMPSVQAIHLIGKQGFTVKSIQEESGALISVLDGDVRAYYASTDERIVDIQGELLKVLKALEAVIGHLRKFLVDHSVIPLFEKSLNKPATQDHVLDAWSDQKQSLLHSPQQTGIDNHFPPPFKREFSFLDREMQRDSQVLHGELSPYEQDPALSGLRFSRVGRSAGSLVTQVTQTMQIPIRYEEDVIGSGGGNIAYIRGRSGAALSILETSRFGEIVLEIMGTPTQVQTAQQLIEDSIARHDSFNTRSGPAFSQLTNTAYPSSSLTTQTYGGYDGRDIISGSAYSPLTDTGYPSSSLTRQTYGGYGSPGLGGYSGYRY